MINAGLTPERGQEIPPELAGLRQATVLVTGASGFLGCRVAEYLSLGVGCTVKALVRNFGSIGLPRLARLRVELVTGDLLDPASLATAARGCDHVVHCGYGNSGDAEIRRKTNVEGTRNVLEAARSGGARKVVHISTSMVHGTPNDKTVTEDHPYQYWGRVYYDSKIEAEKVAMDYAHHQGLNVAILRPTRIYGPWSEQFTVQPIRNTKQGTAILVEDGRAKANLVYVDNVCEAILLCLWKAESSGQAFLVNDEEQVTWREYHEAHAKMIAGAPALRSMTLADIERHEKKQAREVLRKSVTGALRIVKSGVRGLYQDVPLVQIPANAVISRLPQKIGAGLRARLEAQRHPDVNPNGTGQGSAAGSPSGIPELWRARSFAADCWFSNEKIKSVLGYRQKVSFSEAMRLTQQWAEWARLL
ncbi:MAG: NAD-dependent epimerase/dehydratase family protein [Candidatus Binatia bacterium]